MVHSKKSKRLNGTAFDVVYGGLKKRLKEELSHQQIKLLCLQTFQETVQRVRYRTKAYGVVAEMYNVSPSSVENWVGEFECDSDLKEDLRGRHSKSVWMLNDPWAKETFVEWVRANTRRKKQPNLTCECVAQYVTQQLIPSVRKRICQDECKTLKLEDVPLDISGVTAGKWMKRVGIHWTVRKGKCVYSDGHKRKDVVDYRQCVFSPFMKRLECRSPIIDPDTLVVSWPDGCEVDMDPELNDGDLREVAAYPMPVVTVTHDESANNANDDQSGFWLYEGDTVCHRFVTCSTAFTVVNCC